MILVEKATLNDLVKEAYERGLLKSEKCWVTKEGKVIPIKKMTDAHLINAINGIQRYLHSYNEDIEDIYGYDLNDIC